MMRRKKYIHALLYVFGLSGLLTGVLWGMRSGVWSGVQFGFLFGISLTVFVALVVLPLDFFLTKDASNAELDVKQNEEISVSGNPAYVFQGSLEVVANLGTMKHVRPLRDRMMITARTRASLFSFGEEIRLRVIAVDEGEVKILISSEPVLRRTKIDYGRNLKNVRSIGKAIAERFKTSVDGGKDPA